MEDKNHLWRLAMILLLIGMLGLAALWLRGSSAASASRRARRLVLHAGDATETPPGETGMRRAEMPRFALRGGRNTPERRLVKVSRSTRSFV